MFLPEADDQIINSRVAIFLSSNLTQPLIGFNSYTSSRDLLEKIENLNNHVGRHFQVFEELKWRAMQYFKEMEAGDDNTSRVVVFLCLSQLEHAQEDSCFALEFHLNPTNINESWIQVSTDTDHANAVLCEYEVNTYDERGFAIGQVNDKRTNNDVMKESNENIGYLGYLEQVNFEMASYKCSPIGQHVLASFIRDGYLDCPDSSDEQIGGTKLDACAGMFICDIKIDYVKKGFEKYRSVVTKTCVEEEKICDGVYDCHDKMDENTCNVCMEMTLSNGICLPTQWFFKFNFYCMSKLQRVEICVNNDKIKRVEEMLALYQETEYVHREDANIHVVRCVAGRYSNNSRSSFQHNNVTWAAKCIHLVQRYRRDKGIGCSDMSHLANCENFVCSKALFKCPDSYCIPYYMVSDGHSDCPGGEEESFSVIFKLMQVHLMTCRGFTRLVHPAHVCDGINNCPARDDELHCYEKCPAGFGCGYGVTQVNNHNDVDHGELFLSIDKSTRVLVLSGIALRTEYFKNLHGAIQLFEIYLSNCSLSNEIVFEFISLYWHAMRYLTFIDLSYNDIVIGTNSDIAENLRILNLSHTHVKDFVLNVSYTRNWVVDFSFSDLNSLTIVGEVDIALDFLNISYTKLNTLWISKSHISIATLDIRNTSLKFDTNTSKILKSLTIKSYVYGDNYKLCCSKFSCPGIQSVKCFAPDDPITSCDNLLGNFVKRSLLWLTAFIGIVGNVAVIIIKYVKNYDPSTFKHSTFNIVLSDLIMSVYLLFIAGADVYYRDDYVLHDTEWRDSSLCKAAGFLATLSYVASGVFVVLITAQLYNVHRHPTQERQTVGFSLVSLYVCVWCLCVVISLLPILIPAVNIYSSNALCIGFPLPNKQQHVWMLAIFIHIIVSGVEISLTVIGLILILKVILFDSSCVESEINNTKTLFLIILSNIIGGSIISVTGLLSAVEINISPNRMGWLSVFVLPLNSAINPLLFVWQIVQQKWAAYKART
ncbi:G-protein coupled receptor GRL101-like [Physella acuta]|uniref:G-protein coupled receptor GRL101-like n=1 Tax=Physella acuta TaxID=109671 RepID=UPI0027DCEFCE|nr:G-protein coupled receptor GRL101-like [Physella acuta]